MPVEAAGRTVRLVGQSAFIVPGEHDDYGWSLARFGACRLVLIRSSLELLRSLRVGSRLRAHGSHGA